MESPANPTKFYNDLNSQFFDGKLPRYRVTFSKGVFGPWKGFCLGKRRLIRLRRGLPPQEVKRVLLHEMCHIGAKGHGRRWQEKMLRLAAQGEIWAKEEVENYQHALRTKINMATDIRDELTSFAHNISPRPAFKLVLRRLAAHHGYRPRQFSKQYPWLEAA